MAHVQANGIRIEFDDRGPRAGDVVVLIAGLGEQIGSVEFPDEFCAHLVDRGFRVIRMDNRDAGLSTGFDDHHVDLSAAFAARAAGKTAAVPYTRIDMADDVAGLVDALGIKAAHLMGASMGGFIARLVTLRHAAKVRSLTLVMTGSGADPGDSEVVFHDDPERLRLLISMTEQLGERELAIARLVDVWRAMWGPGSPFEETWIRARVTAAYERSYRPEGIARQLAAGLAPTGLFAAQSRITVPTVIIHGDCDRIVSVEHAHVTATAIPSARLQVITGMGHEMAPQMWPQLIQSFLDVAQSS